MNERGHYGSPSHHRRALVAANPIIPPPTPGDLLSQQLTGHSPWMDTVSGMLLVVGTLAVVGVGGVIGLGLQVVSKPKEHVPVTRGQRIARVGIVGGLLGAGTYAYFSGTKKAAPSAR